MKCPNKLFSCRCGIRPKIVNDCGTWCVWCNNSECDIKSIERYSKKLAIEAWNILQGIMPCRKK